MTTQHSRAKCSQLPQQQRTTRASLGDKYCYRKKGGIQSRGGGLRSVLRPLHLGPKDHALNVRAQVFELNQHCRKGLLGLVKLRNNVRGELVLEFVAVGLRSHVLEAFLSVLFLYLCITGYSDHAKDPPISIN